MPARRFVLPLLLSATAVATLTGGLVSAADLRAEERRQRQLVAERRAAEAEKKAVVAYQQALTPLAVSLYDTVQPLQQAYLDLDLGTVSAIDVLIDVGNAVAAEDALPALKASLEAMTPAPSLVNQHAQLVTALDGLIASARTSKALESSDDGDTYTSLVAEGDLSLDEATRDWTRPLTPIFAGATAPPVPVEAGTAGKRLPRSHPSFLRDAGNLCSAGIDALDKVRGNGGDPSLEQIRAGLKELSGRIAPLAKVQAAPADEKLVQDSIRAPLQRAVDIERGFQAAVAAAQRGDRAGLRAGRAQIARGEIAAQKAAAGYRAYGSQICGLYLVGLEDDASAGAEEDTRTT